jgi:hypothetical protein
VVGFVHEATLGIPELGTRDIHAGVLDTGLGQDVAGPEGLAVRGGDGIRVGQVVCHGVKPFAVDVQRRAGDSNCVKH